MRSFALATALCAIAPPTTPAPTAPPPPLLPGDACAQAGGSHVFRAAAWADTCECTDPNFPPQSNGSFCVWWSQGTPCQEHPACGTKPADSVCRAFDNVLPMPKMLGVSWLVPFGDTANVTAPLYAAAVNKQPAGARTLLLHDVDQGIAADPADRVLLPASAADCADPPPTCEAGDDTAGCAPGAAPLGPSFVSIWWDSAVNARRLQSMEFFAAFKAAGGELDQLVLDSEEGSWGMPKIPAPPAASLPAANRTAALRCIRVRRTVSYWNPALPKDSKR